MSDNTIDSNEINYTQLIDDAMHQVVKSVLIKIRKTGTLPGEHHFFITFKTNHPDVMIDNSLREKYPEEMTIVLQHQFHDLEVEEDYFSVVLSFDHVKQNLTIPFDSLVSFVDPSVKFGLQFNTLIFDEEEIEEAEIISELEEELEKTSKPKSKKTKSLDKGDKGVSNVVTLDSFRKKNGGKKDV
jgi:hypothetical protein